MFRPNQTGRLERLTGRDQHSRPTYAAAVPLPHAVIHLNDKNQKTSVRADSSASRGAADEVVVDGKILVAKSLQVARGDRVHVGDGIYAIMATHKRWTVFGLFDHTECVLERLP